MPYPVFTPPIPPAEGTEIEPDVKVLETKFGDGYGQAAPDGINNIRRTYRFTWAGLSPSESGTIIAFLEGQCGAYAFDFIPPGETALRRFTCKKWKLTRKTYYIHEITADFVQSFNL